MTGSRRRKTQEDDGKIRQPQAEANTHGQRWRSSSNDRADRHRRESRSPQIETGEHNKGPADPINSPRETEGHPDVNGKSSNPYSHRRNRVIGRNVTLRLYQAGRPFDQRREHQESAKRPDGERERARRRVTGGIHADASNRLRLSPSSHLRRPGFFPLLPWRTRGRNRPTGQPPGNRTYP